MDGEFLMASKGSNMKTDTSAKVEVDEEAIPVRLRRAPDADGTDAAAHAAWRYYYRECLDRLDSIRQGLEKHHFYLSELKLLNMALREPERQAWHPKEP